MNHHLVLFGVLFLVSIAHALSNITIDHTDANITYYPAESLWSDVPADDLLPGLDYFRTNAQNATASFAFWGVALFYITPIWPVRTNQSVQIDQNPLEYLNLFNASAAQSNIPTSFETITLAQNMVYGAHFVTIRKADGQQFFNLGQFLVTVPDSSDAGSSTTAAPSASIPQSSSNSDPPSNVNTKHDSNLRLIIPVAVGGAALITLLVALIMFFKFPQYCCCSSKRKSNDKPAKPTRWPSMKFQRTKQNLGVALAQDSPHVQRMRNFETLAPTSPLPYKKSSNGDHYYPPSPSSTQKLESDQASKDLPYLSYLSYAPLITERETPVNSEVERGTTEVLKSRNPYRQSLDRSTSTTLHGSPPSSSLDHSTSSAFNHLSSTPPSFSSRSTMNTNHPLPPVPHSTLQHRAESRDIDGPTISHPYQFQNQPSLNSTMAPNSATVALQRPRSARISGREKEDRSSQSRDIIYEDVPAQFPQTATLPIQHPAPQAPQVGSFAAISALSGPPRTPSRSSTPGHQRSGSTESRPRRSLPVPPVQHITHVTSPTPPMPPPSSFNNHVGSSTTRYYPSPTTPAFIPFENKDMYDDGTFRVPTQAQKSSYDPVWRPEEYEGYMQRGVPSSSNHARGSSDSQIGNSSTRESFHPEDTLKVQRSVSLVADQTPVKRPLSRAKTPISDVSHLQGTRLM